MSIKTVHTTWSLCRKDWKLCWTDFRKCGEFKQFSFLISQWQTALQQYKCDEKKFNIVAVNKQMPPQTLYKIIQTSVLSSLWHLLHTMGVISEASTTGFQVSWNLLILLKATGPVGSDRASYRVLLFPHLG